MSPKLEQIVNLIAANLKADPDCQPLIESLSDFSLKSKIKDAIQRHTEAELLHAPLEALTTTVMALAQIAKSSI